MTGAIDKMKEALESEAPAAPVNYFYDIGRKEYLIPRHGGGWLPITETQMKRHLKAQGYRSTADRGESVSPLDAALNWMQLRAGVDYAGPLAGYSAGHYIMQGRPILVTSSPQLVEPIEGAWSTISNLLTSLLRDEHHKQVDVFVSWLKVALDALRQQESRPGQAAIFAGPKDCGKSLFQNLVTLLFGGRAAKPFQAALGLTQFNSDLFEAEHLMVEDEAPSTDIRARRQFGAFIKGIAANEGHRLHAKHRDAVHLEPIWRLTVSVNDDPEHLLVLPPLDASLLDKIHLFKCNPPPIPFNDGSMTGRREYMDKLISEIPAFVHHLTMWKVPETLRCTRYGVKAFQHPEVVAAITDLSAEVQLLNLIDLVIYFPASGQPWEGTAEELERELREHENVRYEVGRLLSFPRACGTFLSRLVTSDQYGQRVKRAPRSSSNNRCWIIHPNGIT